MQPNPPRWGWMALAVLALTAPLWVSALHHAVAWGDAPRVVSHDGLGLQLDRALEGLQSLGGGPSPARESAASLGWFLLEPLAWMNAALGSEAPPVASGWRGVALAFTLAGSLLEWRSRSNSPSAALLRFMSLYTPLQLLALWLANRDLHHLAQASPTLAIWTALALDRLAATRAPGRSAARAVLATLLALPAMVGGVRSLAATDAALAQLHTPMLRRAGQEALVGLLDRCARGTVWTSDYELYGALELLRPEGVYRHAWGDVSRRFGEREAALHDLLQGAAGGSYLVVRPSAPMIYNLNPSAAQLERAAAELGLPLTRCAGLEDARGEWATLYQVGAPTGPLSP